jgi:D-alanyl-D-alanine carboxypeptidase (penicillin-binding protein 5/6)
MRSHNRLLRSVEGCDGLKTGYFRLAGFSIIATAERDGCRVLAVVLGCKDKQVRDAEAARLINEGFAALRGRPPRDE